MTRIAIVHPDFDFPVRGGAEAVSMNVLQSLQQDYDLTLFTFDAPDFESLNEFYDTSVEDVSIREPTSLPKVVHSSIVRVNRLSDGQIGGLLSLRAAALNRYVREHQREFDLLFSTHNEFCFDIPSIHYVHAPFSFPTATISDLGMDRIPTIFYEVVCRSMAKFDLHAFQEHSTLLASSNWIADELKDRYSADTQVVYPPFQTNTVANQTFPPWEERESGFITLGRLSPDKNVLRNIEIVTELRRTGYDVHMHLIGPTHSPRYRRRIEDKISNLNFISLEGKLTLDEIKRMLATHKFGLHGRENEPLGGVVAEMVAAGMIPFVHNSGGPREIIGSQEVLLYDTVDEAVEKIGGVITDQSFQSYLREELPNVQEKFGRERFKDKIKTVVSNSLSNTHGE